MVMYVITHKHFNYTLLPDGYKPLMVGANKNSNPDDFLTDNTGVNISDKNPSYCELTGLYWMWKNPNQNKNVGLSHYRRFFASFNNRKSMYCKMLVSGHVNPIRTDELDALLREGYQWIVPQPESGGPGTLWNQFDRNHNINDLRVLEKIITQDFPDYKPAFDKYMKHSKKGSFYNMFYTTKQEMDNYCEWLFSVLSKVELATDISNYDKYQQRLYGFFGERLLNVWLIKRQAQIKYLPVFNMDSAGRKQVLKLIKERIIY
ncbi:DUF4422 domain-containing protein [Limosilactobacillus caecicola]|uniref:DUF4422 domain-containing protein n=1 Tax=Limosilactobacillus caecicola TaxID=2941332 RepID=UPI002040FF34|nr:DUF4422 domain-containing protein [Limosilactobacillus caecicola]